MKNFRAGRQALCGAQGVLVSAMSKAGFSVVFLILTNRNISWRWCEIPRQWAACHKLTADERPDGFEELWPTFRRRYVSQEGRSLRV